jgi:hypothetical protein
MPSVASLHRFDSAFDFPKAAVLSLTHASELRRLASALFGSVTRFPVRADSGLYPEFYRNQVYSRKPVRRVFTALPPGRKADRGGSYQSRNWRIGFGKVSPPHPAGFAPAPARSPSCQKLPYLAVEWPVQEA